jgi:ribosomal protein L40E
LSKAKYCRCGAANPTDVHYCWNCGKKNKNVEPKPPLLLPYDLDELQEQVRLEGGMAKSQTIGRSIALYEELKRQGIIFKITHCKHCGAQNEATAARCQKCGKKISIDRSIKKPKMHKKPWWKFW